MGTMCSGRAGAIGVEEMSTASSSSSELIGEGIYHQDRAHGKDMMQWVSEGGTTYKVNEITMFDGGTKIYCDNGPTVVTVAVQR